MSFYNLFQHIEEYPDNIAEQGIPNNTLFEFVSSSFLNGFINYTEPFWGCVIERYKVWKDIDMDMWKKYLFDPLPPHAHLDYFDDDVLILSETANCFWFFWFDCDVSDCQIGRIDKSLITKDEMRDLLVEWIKSHDYTDRPLDTESVVGNYYELSVKYLKRGWISF